MISPENIEIIQPKNGFINLRDSLASTMTFWNSLELNYPILKDGSFISGEDLRDQFVSYEMLTGSKIAIYWKIIVNDEYSNLNDKDIQSLLSKHLGVETSKLTVFDRVKSREQSARIYPLTYVSYSNVSLGVIIFLISFFLIINTKEYYQNMSLLYTKYGIHKIIKKQLISMNLVIFSFILLSMLLSTFIAHITVVHTVFNIYFYQGLIISSDIYIVYTIKYLSIIFASYIPLSVLSNILFYNKIKRSK